MRPPSSSSSSSTATAAALLATATSKLLRSSVEWNPKVASYLFRNTTAAPATGTSSSQSSSSSSSSSYFVLPDLPELLITNTDAHDEFCRTITNPKQRIITIATCHHSARSLLHTVASPTMEPGTTLLLVGGNTKNGTMEDTNWKTTTSLSSLEAAQLLTQERETVQTYPLWGVMNPNDPKSVDVLAQKITAGMTGFITQPCFTSDATDTLYRYRDCCESHHTNNNSNNNNNRIPILAGVACPKTLRGLQFWSKLVTGDDDELWTLVAQDPVFQRHVWYFSQPSVPSLAWSSRELHDLVVQHCAVLDGIHFMPLQNTEDFGALLPLFHQLNRQQHQQQ